MPIHRIAVNTPVLGFSFVLTGIKVLNFTERMDENGEIIKTEGSNYAEALKAYEVLGKPESLITYVTDRKGHDLRYAIDPTKLETELGWKPKYNFDTGIQQTIQWYLDNKEWWQNILSGEYQNYFQKMYVEKGRVEE